MSSEEHTRLISGTDDKTRAGPPIFPDSTIKSTTSSGPSIFPFAISSGTHTGIPVAVGYQSTSSISTSSSKRKRNKVNDKIMSSEYETSTPIDIGGVEDRKIYVVMYAHSNVTKFLENIKSQDASGKVISGTWEFGTTSEIPKSLIIEKKTISPCGWPTKNITKYNDALNLLERLKSEPLETCSYSSGEEYIAACQELNASEKFKKEYPEGMHPFSIPCIGDTENPICVVFRDNSAMLNKEYKASESATGMRIFVRFTDYIEQTEYTVNLFNIDDLLFFKDIVQEKLQEKFRSIKNRSEYEIEKLKLKSEIRSLKEQINDKPTLEQFINSKVQEKRSLIPSKFSKDDVEKILIQYKMQKINNNNNNKKLIIN